jgi:hypothetical protein
MRTTLGTGGRPLRHIQRRVYVSLLDSPNFKPVLQSEFFPPSDGSHLITGAGNIASAQAFGSPAVAATVSTTGIASAEAFGQPTILTGHEIVGAGNIASAQAFGSPSLAANVSPAGIVSAGAFGQPGIRVSIVTSGIPSGEAFGSPAISIRLGLLGIPSSEAFGLPTLSVPTVHSITDVGNILSGEFFGRPLICLPTALTTETYELEYDGAENFILNRADIMKSVVLALGANEAVSLSYQHTLAYTLTLKET